MKNLFFLLCVLVIFSCGSEQKKPDASKPVTEKKAVENIKTGWADEDTYTVKVIAKNESIAKEKADNKILKDIINVRMMNQSKYTDITKIQEEFKDPLKNGTIISSKNVAEGIEIYYQIKDKDLKKKFERK